MVHPAALRVALKDLPPLFFISEPFKPLVGVGLVQRAHRGTRGLTTMKNNNSGQHRMLASTISEAYPFDQACCGVSGSAPGWEDGAWLGVALFLERTLLADKKYLPEPILMGYPCRVPFNSCHKCCNFRDDIGPAGRMRHRGALWPS